MANNLMMFKPKLLTIATINLNNSDGLKRTIRSFEKLREMGEIEFVFHDGKSNDDSLNIARHFYRDNEIVSESDKGIYDAMNKTLYRSNAKYIIWINSGDEVFADQLGSASSMLALRNQNNSIISWTSAICSKPGCKVDKTFHPVALGIGPRQKKILYQLPHPSTAFNRIVLIRLNGYKIKYRVCADLDLMLRMQIAELDCIKFFNETVAIFYQDGISSIVDWHNERLRVLLDNGLIGLMPYFYYVGKHKMIKLKRHILSMVSNIR